MLRIKFSEIFHQVQQTSTSHQKYCQILLNLYKKTSFQDFECEFMKCLHKLFAVEDVSHKQIHVERCIAFAAAFVGTLMNSEKQAEEEMHNEDDSNSPSHPFLNAIIQDVIAYHNLDCVSARYRSCQFINLVLNSIGTDANINVNIWNSIEDAMLERTQDTKPNVRLQAVKALMRLQVPLNSECPVIKSLVAHLTDCSPMVRKEVVDIIAPNPTTIPKLVERARDTDHTVRLAAYRKFAVMGPRALRIVDRQSIMNSGFNERHAGVKQVFLEDTLPKWLTAYNGDFLKFLNALKLDAYEEDIKQTEIVCRTHQFTRIVEYLPIDENKIIPIDKLSNESALFWCILNNYLRKSEKTEEYADDIVPELLLFSNYIQKVYETKSVKIMENWEFLEYQYILSQLFIMAGEFDLCDEVGRQALHKVIVDILTVAKLDHCVIKEMIAILAKITPALDTLTIDICHLISDIREPLIEQPQSQETVRQHEFKVAELRVKINILTEEQAEAVAKCDFERAAVIKNRLIGLNKQVEELVAGYQTTKTMVKASQNDPDSICRCLNILIGILSYPLLKSLTASLRSCKDEFLTPLREHDNIEVSLRVYKSIMLYCTLDQQFAQECVKFICTPIILYRLIPNYDKNILIASIAAVSDFMRLYGSDIFGVGDETAISNASNMNKRRSNATRRLYRISQIEDVEAFDFQSITSQDLVDVLLDMIDDEIEDIRVQACKALCELIMDRIAVSSSLMCRLILKWLSPLTEKHDSKLQQCLGKAIIFYAQCVEGSEEVLEKAVLPVLTSIGNAPHTSPLADIDVENALGFLAAITSIEKQNGYVNSHKNLAFELCYKISLKPDDKCVSLFVKMLHHLELSSEEIDIMRELMNQSKIIIEEISDKVPKRNMQKFMTKLNALLTDLENVNIVSNHASLQSLQNNDLQSLSKNSISFNEENNLVADRSRRSGKVSRGRKSVSDVPKVNGVDQAITQKLRKLVINVTPLDLCKLARLRSEKNIGANLTYNDETVLHTIIEDESEMGVLEDEDVIIETPTTSSTSSNSTNSRNHKGKPRKLSPNFVNGTNGTFNSEKGTKRKGKSINRDTTSSSFSSNESIECKQITKAIKTVSNSGSPKRKLVKRSGKKRKQK